MNKFVKRRVKTILIAGCLIVSGITLILYILEDKITFFYTPSKITEEMIGIEIKLGGLVKLGSIVEIAINKISFVVTDEEKDIKVQYEGPVPQLFREGQGIVVVGKMQESREFAARQLLTKHDEKYSPPKK